jgi:hypothetical protein
MTALDHVKISQQSDVSAQLRESLKTIGGLIHHLLENEQKTLLQLLEDWQRPERRRLQRKLYSLPVDFADGNRAFSGFVRDINGRGVRIEPSGLFHVGQGITLSFPFPGLSKPIKTQGEIVWTDKQGFGVELAMPNKYLEEYVQKKLEYL